MFIKTFGNPNSSLIDIDAVAAIAHSHKIPLIIDNTFGTPYLIRPIEHGADIVVHSVTTTHSQLSDEELKEQGIFQSTIRLSIGTEHIDDIIADLDRAFEQI